MKKMILGLALSLGLSQVVVAEKVEVKGLPEDVAVAESWIKANPVKASLIATGVVALLAGGTYTGVKIYKSKEATFGGKVKAGAKEALYGISFGRFGALDNSKVVVVPAVEVAADKPAVVATTEAAKEVPAAEGDKPAVVAEPAKDGENTAAAAEAVAADKPAVVATTEAAKPADVVAKKSWIKTHKAAVIVPGAVLAVIAAAVIADIATTNKDDQMKITQLWNKLIKKASKEEVVA